jgi:predicted DCC family thiol-disulfide oxidoreductase YuxK
VKPAGPATTVLFYDGVCGLCNRLIQFLLRRDRHGRIAYATLQGKIAREVLAKHGADPSDLDTVYVVADWRTPSERALSRSAAILHALGQLDGSWGVLARLGTLVPTPIGDLAYRLVASTRYRVFGKHESCPLPPPEWRRRFLD